MSGGGFAKARLPPLTSERERMKTGTSRVEAAFEVAKGLGSIRATEGL